MEVDLGRGPEQAYCLTDLIGGCAVGDRVVVNTTAVELGLGTGGWHVVHWNLARDRLDIAGGGHVMKLRYTSLQADTGAAEEAEGYEAPVDLGGRPVVSCFLHSQVACVAAVAPAGARVVYVMTDTAALPVAMSDLVHELRTSGRLAATVSAGQAFGGDHEAVNLTSALDVAVAAAGADIVIVGPGPGVVGTDSPHGFSGLGVAACVDATAARGGTPIVAVRWSDADPRPRHRGISHHVGTALGQARARACVPIPTGEAAAVPSAIAAAHDVVEVDVPDMSSLLGVSVTTMGRTPADDPGFFRWAAAAGIAASLPR